MSIPKPDNIMQLLRNLLVSLYDVDAFYVYARNLYNNFTKSILSEFLFISLFDFVAIAGQNFKKGRKYWNLNNCHNCIFMLCSYKSSHFCFVAIKINVKVLSNYWAPYQQIFFFLIPGWSWPYIDWFEFGSLSAVWKQKGI